MNRQTIQRIIFTGGPGAGKSTLIGALAQQGYATIAESGRAIIQHQTKINGDGVPWINPQHYAELMLVREIQTYQDVPDLVISPKAHSIFYDRALPDIAGYLQTIDKEIPAHLSLAINQYRYYPQVFIFPPWLEIYAQDRERKQSFDEAVKTYETMTEIYHQAGYLLIQVPQLSVQKRLQFVLSALQKSEKALKEDKG